MDKACSAAVVHKTAFCQAPLRAAYYQGAQCSRLSRARAEPVCRVKWIRRHGTFPSCHLRRSLHSRSATWQAMLLATSGSVSTRQRQDMMDGGLREQARESKKEISFACNAIMYEQSVILYCIVGPTCRGSNSRVRTPLRYKREVPGVHRTISTIQTQALANFSLSWEGNTTHSGRRVLRSGGPNHSKSCCVHRVLE